MKNFADKLKAAEKEKQKNEEAAKRGQFQATDETRKKAAQVIAAVQSEMAAQIVQSGGVGGMSEKLQFEMNESIRNKAAEVGADFNEIQQIQNLAISSTGMGPLDDLLNDDNVTEIVVQRYNNILYEKNGILEKYNGQFKDENHLQVIIQKLIQPTGKTLNIANPLVDASWEDGSRINATIPPASPKGATLTIRKFSDKAFTEKDYLKFGTIDQRMIKFLEACVEGKINIFISGGTGTGKTTFINMLSNFIPENEIIVTIEDTPELKLTSPNVRSLVTRESRNEEMMSVSIEALVKNALRMRPDRIILGETRGGEIVDLLSAMSTGHEGSMSTIHANDPRNLVNSRYPIVYGQNKNMKVPVEVQNIQFAEAVQLIVQLKRFPKGTDKIKKGSRKVVYVTAVDGIDENGRIILKDIYRYDEENDRFYATGYYPKRIMEALHSNGISFDEDMFPKDELNFRETLSESVDIPDTLDISEEIDQLKRDDKPSPHENGLPKTEDIFSNRAIITGSGNPNTTPNAVSKSDFKKNRFNGGTDTKRNGAGKERHPIAGEENFD